MNVVVATLLLVITFAPSAFAHMVCFPEGVVQERLKSVYNESIMFEGTVRSIYTEQLWVNLNTGTWSVVIVKPNGEECVALEGQEFRVYKGPGIESWNETSFETLHG